jgi:predicted Fe-Mo cluster-binding NifX family protein
MCVTDESMIIGIPIWQGRVSPVFDVAGQLLVVELNGSVESTRRQESLPDEAPERRTQRLQILGVETLICGAISRPLEALLAAGGIEVIPRICGETEDVLRAFLSSRLQDDQFAMPGCCGQKRRRHRGGCGRNGRQSDR